MHHQPFSDYTSPSASSSFYDNLGNSGSQGPSRSVSGTQQYQHFQYQQQRSPHQQSSHQQQQSHQKHLNLSPYLNSIDSGIISSPSSSSCNVFSSSSSHGLPPPPQHQQSLHLDPSGGQQPVHLLSLDPDEYLQKFHNRIKAVLVEAGRAKLTADTCAERVNSVIRSFPVELKTYEGCVVVWLGMGACVNYLRVWRWRRKCGCMVAVWENNCWEGGGRRRQRK